MFKLPYEEFSWVEKDKKDCWKLKSMELVQIYLIFLKICWQLLRISLHFFSFFLILFPPVSGFRRENECGSGSTPWLEKQMWHHKVLWKRMCTTVEEQNYMPHKKNQNTGPQHWYLEKICYVIIWSAIQTILCKFIFLL